MPKLPLRETLLSVSLRLDEWITVEKALAVGARYCKERDVLPILDNTIKKMKFQTGKGLKKLMKEDEV